MKLTLVQKTNVPIRNFTDMCCKYNRHTANVVQLADRIGQRAQLAATWRENMQSMWHSCGWGNYTIPLSWKTDKKSGPNNRKQNLDELDKEIEGIVRCFTKIENIKQQSLIKRMYDGYKEIPHMENPWTNRITYAIIGILLADYI